MLRASRVRWRASVLWIAALALLLATAARGPRVVSAQPPAPGSSTPLAEAVSVEGNVAAQGFAYYSIALPATLPESVTAITINVSPIGDADPDSMTQHRTRDIAMPRARKQCT